MARRTAILSAALAELRPLMETEFSPVRVSQKIAASIILQCPDRSACAFVLVEVRRLLQGRLLDSARQRLRLLLKRVRRGASVTHALALDA